VTGPLEITGADRARLPAARVNGLAAAGQVRDVPGAWRAALVLAGYREHQPGGGATWLHAAARCDLVRVRLTAAVPAGVQEDQ
jgi:hypothetical protein